MPWIHWKSAMVMLAFVTGMAAHATATQSGPGQAVAVPVDTGGLVPRPRLEDVATPHATVQAIYDVISGEAGEKRDWNRFRSLFHPNAQMIPTGKDAATGEIRARVVTPDEYINLTGPKLEKGGSHEQEIAYREERYGNIAHIFSTFAARRKASDAEPSMRGINSFQLYNDGKRWWVLNVTWTPEAPDHPIPEIYLTSRK